MENTKNKPKIVLNIDEKSDIEMAVNFAKNNRDFAKMMFPKDLQYVLDDNFSKIKRSRNIREYAKIFYRDNKKEIKKGLNLVKESWKKTKGDYFNFVNKLFKNHSWPRGFYCNKYYGIVSIFLMYPRNIQKQYFYFPYEHKIKNFSVATIGHELLHFIFFDYIKNKYGINENDEFEGKDHRFVWQVSEAFNVLIENLPEYKKIMKVSGEAYTAEQEKIYKKMKKQWSKKQDIDWLLDQWFKDINF